MFLVPGNLALGVDTAGIGQETEVDTGTLHTALAGLAVPVPYTLHPATLHLGVALQSLGTEADRAVVGHPALGSGGAAGGGAGALALAGQAVLLVGAVVVPGTAGEASTAPALVSLWTGHGSGTLPPTSTGDTGLTAGAGGGG